MADLESTALAEVDHTAAGEVPEQRARAALALKISGAPYSAIAEHLGFANARIARVVVERYLSEMVTDADLKPQRALASERLERLLRAVWPRAISETTEWTDPDGKRHVTPNAEQLQYVRTALMIIDRSARLHGIDAPQKLEVTRPSDEEVTQWAFRMAEEAGMMGVREAEDIMEAELVEADPEEE